MIKLENSFNYFLFKVFKGSFLAFSIVLRDCEYIGLALVIFKVLLRFFNCC